MSNKFPCKIEIPIKNESELVMLYSLLNVSDYETVIKGADISCLEYINKYTPIFKVSTIEIDGFLTSVFAIVKNKIQQINNSSKKVSHITKINTEIIEKKGKEYVKILGFENIKNIYELPQQYREGYPIYYKASLLPPAFNKVILHINGILKVIFEIGDVIEKTKFEEYVEIMKQAGERLVQCNKIIKEDKRMQQIKKDVKERAEELYNCDKDKINKKNNHIYTI